MNQKQLKKIKEQKGFIAALDQSGGSTPRALKAYGVEEDSYKNEKEMFDLVHEMRTRIIKNKAFSGDKIIAAILFEQTMEREIDGLLTGDFLWQKKEIVPFVKVDKGLSDNVDGVQVMKPMPELDDLLKRAAACNIFGTKMRSVINEYNEEGIKKIVDQQFEIGKKISSYGLVPILEPEVNIKSADKEKIEDLLLKYLLAGLEDWPQDKPLMFKLSIPSKANLYKPLIENEKVLRVVALSGGYSREDANEKLALNNGLIASFSRALSEGLRVDLSEEEFTKVLGKAVDSIYEASLS